LSAPRVTIQAALRARFALPFLGQPA